MADTYTGIDRPNWVSSSGVQTLGSNMEFITIVTKVDIRTAAQASGSAASQANLNKLLEIVGLRGQPVMMGSIAGPSSTLYTIVLATEHKMGWGCVNGDTTINLKSRLIADGYNYGFGRNVNSIDDTSSLAVTFADTLS